MTLSAFANEPVLELRRAPVRERLGESLASLDARLPLHVPVWVGRGPARRPTSWSRPTRASPSGSWRSRPRATAADVDAAVSAAAGASREWAQRPAHERAATLVRAAALLRERRLELAALAVRECAKPWPEADADVCEAIDFLEYYARGRGRARARHGPRAGAR